MRATGEFDVTMLPLDIHAQGRAPLRFGRLSIDKTFRGDLTAKSQGEMVNVLTGVEGSAGYVALEQVEGTLHGKQGTFVLQHFGILARGASRLILEVVPDSATGELTGLAGSMTINIEDGHHHYSFEYQLP